MSLMKRRRSRQGQAGMCDPGCKQADLRASKPTSQPGVGVKDLSQREREKERERGGERASERASD
eukprot:14859587-Alexandrium_andersonii.AAC.1